jgi:hypothetical protein
MKLTFEDIPFIIHDCTLFNFNLNDKTFYFRLGIPSYKAKQLNDQISDDDTLILDIILYNVQIKDISLPTADFRFVKAEVLDLDIDQDGNTKITLLCGDYCILNLKCESNEIIQKQIIKTDQWWSKDITEEDFFEIK